MKAQKPVHSVILDAGPILKNDPSISTLLAKSEQIYTVSSVISEIKDVNARSRAETTFLPFVTLRDPELKSIKFISDFAGKTGDLAVLSKPDISILALAYELECERNGGDWRLRRVPGQKGINGPIPQKNESSSSEAVPPQHGDRMGLDSSMTQVESRIEATDVHELDKSATDVFSEISSESSVQMKQQSDSIHAMGTTRSSLESIDQQVIQHSEEALAAYDTRQPSDSESCDSEGWITPSNLKKQQAKDRERSSMAITEGKVMQVATITTDFAMQNVLLQMGLNLLSPSIQQVRHIKTYILRCHACFAKCKDMAKQFCPRCGKPTLTRVSCSTNAKGEFQIHLKKNMQWNHRGDRFSIPKPVSGAANGKTGQGKGWR